MYKIIPGRIIRSMEEVNSGHNHTQNAGSTISSPPVAVVTHHRPTLGIVVVSDLVVAAHDVEAAVGGRMLESSSPPPAVRAIVVGVAATNDAALSAISALQVPERLTATQPVATHIRSALGHS